MIVESRELRRVRNEGQRAKWTRWTGRPEVWRPRVGEHNEKQDEPEEGGKVARVSRGKRTDQQRGGKKGLFWAARRSASVLEEKVERSERKGGCESRP